MRVDLALARCPPQGAGLRQSHAAPSASPSQVTVGSGDPQEQDLKRPLPESRLKPGVSVLVSPPVEFGCFKIVEGCFQSPLKGAADLWVNFCLDELRV